ncbi:LysR family transcriptional regulator [Paraburkholderia sp.]|uniref:LysR family transcriptional regulator n=1 Tax=Paraburkholderia sp. TaxID=1926495 RepID=UPI003D6FB7C5
MEPDALDGLGVFVRVAEARSFTAAAIAMGVTPSAISHTIRQLENRLDVRLFNRTTRSVSLTEAGAAFLARIQPLVSELSNAVEDVAGSSGKPAGIVRLNVPRTASIVLLEPLLREFLDAHPDIGLDITLDNGLTDVVSQGFDAGIRFGDVLEKDMMAVPLQPDLRVAIVASPDYLARRGVPDHPFALREHDCVHFRMGSTGTLYRWEFERGGESVQIEVGGRLTTNDSLVVLQAALDGVGIAYLFDRYVERFIRSGQLVRVLEEWSPTAGLYLYYFNRSSMPPKLRVLIDFLKDALARPKPARHALSALRTTSPVPTEIPASKRAPARKRPAR